jgi:LCP family protein required for cell wall assembly
MLGVIGLALLLVIGGGVWTWTLWSQLDDITRFELGEAPGANSLQRPRGAPDPGAATVLLAGVDNGARDDLRKMLASGTWDPGAFRSDTIMVLHLPADRSHATLVSIPRDSWVPVAGEGEDKINAAFAEGGPSLLHQTVEQLIDLRINHVMVLDWEGFKGITEAVGGVRLDGETLGPEAALHYVRERKSLPNGDLDRVVRQQDYLLALLTSLREQGTWSSPVSLTRTVDSLEEFMSVDSGLTNEALVSLGWSTRGLTRERLGTRTTPVAGLDTVEGQSVVRLDVEATRDLFDRVVGRPD